MNRGGLSLGGVLCAALVTMLAGCGGAASREWEIAVENRGDVAVDFSITHGVQGPGVDSRGSASVGSVTKGKPVTLLVGPGMTVVRTVKVTRKDAVQELKPEVEIQAGKKYFVVVDADGKASGSVSNR
ncbi:MAG: hypothetical protein H7062_17915 [Candidatus Saccharimonas sp.]|nr:hypothetical protein [Planctomycetaceae bacterium]